jgi:hypothetical protein
MNVLVMNPGGNSLQVELVSCSLPQQFALEELVGQLETLALKLL